jgi:hypothetical protein
MPDAPAGAAATAHEVLFHRTTGFPRDGRIDVAAVAGVLGLRARFGEPRKPLQDPTAYFDPTFLEDAAHERS